MGMFDYVDYEWTCPNCGNKQKNAQTKEVWGKDYYELGLRMQHPAKCKEIHDFCDSCWKHGVMVHLDITIRADTDED